MSKRAANNIISLKIALLNSLAITSLFFVLLFIPTSEAQAGESKYSERHR
ncbi:MAG: hypothetical protein HON32_09130 [Francisellaceae bacterium]|nr:hypothetical protein [Francisellaceae bacterium]MBT6538951.1 hypothetical protein [Francisellaceae bacterium]